MVNLDKWEEIEYADIKKGDRVRCIVDQKSVWNDVRFLASHEAFKGWCTIEGIVGAVDPESFAPVNNGGRKIYRRKPDPVPAFVFPEVMGAVIEAKLKTETDRKRFVWDGADWTDGYRTFGTHDFEHYEDFVTLAAGVK